MADLSPRHWFLPETPDLIGQLRAQLAVTIEGVDALAGWAGGDGSTASGLREIEARGDVARRDLLDTLRAAFITPLEPEDVFTLSRGIDRILDGAGDLVAEAEALDCGPDAGIAEMAGLLGVATRELDVAVGELEASADRATIAADRTIERLREVQAAYYRGMAGTIDLDARGERIARRELYRRCAEISETIADVAERIVYAEVKQR